MLFWLLKLRFAKTIARWRRSAGAAVPERGVSA